MRALPRGRMNGSSGAPQCEERPLRAGRIGERNGEAKEVREASLSTSGAEGASCEVDAEAEVDVAEADEVENPDGARLDRRSLVITCAAWSPSLTGFGSRGEGAALAVGTVSTRRAAREAWWLVDMRG